MPAIASHVPRQNRVTPTGEIVRHTTRGLFMGNRGCLHDARGALGTARWKTRLWVTCRLEFRGRRRALMSPGRYTELFFLDEAVALAAGHRPCGECRRDDYRKFLACWSAGSGTTASPGTLDSALHAARVDRRTRTQRTHRAECDTLPDGVFICIADLPHLLHGGAAIRFENYAYGAATARPRGTVEVLTPAPTVVALRQGYIPKLHDSANGRQP